MGWKKIYKPSTKIPVLMMGVIIAAHMTARRLPLFANKRYKSPAANPASNPLDNITSIVAGGLNVINKGTSGDDISTTKPNTPPSHKPANGPINAAPTTIGTSTNASLNG